MYSLEDKEAVYEIEAVDKLKLVQLIQLENNYIVDGKQLALKLSCHSSE